MSSCNPALGASKAGLGKVAIELLQDHRGLPVCAKRGVG
jgi:hypothetical protein